MLKNSKRSHVYSTTSKCTTLSYLPTNNKRRSGSVPKEGVTTRSGRSRRGDGVAGCRWASIYLAGILCVVYACPRPCPWSILIPSTKTAFFRCGATTTLVDYIGVPDGVPLLFRRPPRGVRPRGAFCAARRCRVDRRKASEHARWREYTLSTEGERPPRGK